MEKKNILLTNEFSPLNVDGTSNTANQFCMSTSKVNQAIVDLIEIHLIDQSTIGQHEPKRPDWDPISSDINDKHGRTNTIVTISSTDVIVSGKVVVLSDDNLQCQQRPKFYGRTILKSPTVVSTRTLLDKPFSLDNDTSFDPIVHVRNNLTKFISTTIPENNSTLIRCCLQRNRNGLQKNLFPTFYFHMECVNNDNKVNHRRMSTNVHMFHQDLLACCT
jgi:hypothetical protein